MLHKLTIIAAGLALSGCINVSDATVNAAFDRVADRIIAEFGGASPNVLPIAPETNATHIGGWSICPPVSFGNTCIRNPKQTYHVDFDTRVLIAVSNPSSGDAGKDGQFAMGASFDETGVISNGVVRIKDDRLGGTRSGRVIGFVSANDLGGAFLFDDDGFTGGFKGKRDE